MTNLGRLKHIIKMESKVAFDLNENNIPVISVKVKPSEDLRDKVAKKFIEDFGHSSWWCTAIFEQDGTMIITPITPQELEKQSRIMAAQVKGVIPLGEE